MGYNEENKRRMDVMYFIRNVKSEDLVKIEEIYAYARSFMAENGNPNQWGRTDPPTAQLLADIRENNLYAVTDDTGIHGVFFFDLGEDPTYAAIYEGKWMDESPYGTIHRIASDGSGGIFAAALGYCKSRCNHIRIDTHEDNFIMQYVLHKHGFVRCGIIYIEDGTSRIAFEYMGKSSEK